MGAGQSLAVTSRTISVSLTRARGRGGRRREESVGSDATREEEEVAGGAGGGRRFAKEARKGYGERQIGSSSRHSRARWESNQNLGHCWILRRRERCLLNHINCRDNRCFDSAPSPGRDEISHPGLHPRELTSTPTEPALMTFGPYFVVALSRISLGERGETMSVLSRGRPGSSG